MDSPTRRRAHPRYSLSPELRLARQAMFFGFGSLVVAAALGLASFLFRALDKSAAFTLWAVPVALALATVGLICGVLGKTAEWREKRSRAEREWNELVASLLRLPVRDRQLPRLDELTDVDLGVTPTRYTAAGNDDYVARPATDEDLRTTLRIAKPPFPFVLLHGHSKAGKSRTMAEAARRERPQAPVVAPHDGKAAADLSRIEPPVSLEASPALVWLDDLSITDLDHLTTTVLDTWSNKALVMATMTTSRYQDALRTGTEVGAVARAALHRAVVRELPFELSNDERITAQRVYPLETLTPADNRPISIGETLVSGEELVRKLRAARDKCPAGQAVAHAAIDARRAGVSRSIKHDELKHLFPLYLRQVNAGIAPTAKQFTMGLDWAATPVASQVAILRRMDTGWDVLDYVVEADAGQHDHTLRPVPPFLWPELLATTTPVDALAIGRTAYSGGLLDIARDALHRAQHHVLSAPLATFVLGELLREQGDVTAAQAAYRQAIDSGDTDAAPLAAISLGMLLHEQGDNAGAQAALQQAIDSGHAIATRATVRLGMLLQEQGDIAGAQAAYQKATDSSDADAAIWLGDLLQEQGNFAGAQAAFQQAIDSGDTDAAPLAAGHLGKLLQEQGNFAGAQAAFQQAIDSGHTDAAPRAAGHLGILLQEQGNFAGAQATLQQAIDSGHTDAAPFAAAILGILLLDQGDNAGAQATLQQAIDSGHTVAAPFAAGSLGILLHEQGDNAGAQAALQQAIDSGHTVAALRAAAILGDLLREQGSPQDGSRQ